MEVVTDTVCRCRQYNIGPINLPCLPLLAVRPKFLPLLFSLVFQTNLSIPLVFRISRVGPGQSVIQQYCWTENLGRPLVSIIDLGQQQRRGRDETSSSSSSSSSTANSLSVSDTGAVAGNDRPQQQQLPAEQSDSNMSSLSSSG